MAHLLGAEHISLSFPTKDVFTDVTVGLDEGARIGVVGRNGDGKSTLLRILAGRQQPDAGRVTVRGGTRIGMLDQSDRLPEDETIHHAVVGDRAEHEWAGDAKVRDVIRGLLGDLPFEALIGELSGGQRRRVALAALLSREWDVVFLDEPTNHLDVEGVAWLAEHLNRRWSKNQGGLVVVTHDRWFLDEVSTDTWEVHDGIIEPFEGGYAAYVLQRVERDRMAAASEAKRQNLMRKELAWLRRGAPARTSKPKFRIDAATQLIEDVPPIRDRVALEKLATSRLGKDVVDLEGVSVAYDGREVLHDVTWRIAPGERTGILGVNGAGKSTLLGLVAGTVRPDTGRVKTGTTVKLAVLDQRLSELDEIANDRVADVIGRQRTSYRVGGGAELTPGQLLERLGFSNAQLSTPVKDLSGGQKRRLQLLLILLDEPNVLILDEPTNDLDTDMLAAMEDLLDSWPGTLLVVSHDRYLLERVTDQQYAVIGGRMRHLPGGVEEYLRLGATAATPAGRVAAPGTPSDRVAAAGAPSAGRVAAEGGVSRPPAPPALAGAERRAAEKELASVERRMAKVAEAIVAQHASFAAADQSDYAGLQRLQEELAALQDEASALEERWLELSEQLEN
ncbi:MAG: ABC transporter ATP-binding protein [Leifsonia xyli]|nr:MAG: ABC transporter ATP-binding protein [Leifsonia xyli]